MSQQTAHTPALDYTRLERPADRFLGLSLVSWLQILIVTALMCALFRFNLIRLWLKTNPIDGQDTNWQHSVFVPIIGLYYLYIHREELLKAIGAPVQNELAIRIIAGVGVLLSLLIGLGQISGGQALSLTPPLALAGLMTLGLLIAVALPTSTVLGTVVTLGGILIFAYGIYPGQNDYFKDIGMVVTVFGVATLLAGWEVMKIAWFPICFLFVGLPWPDQVYSQMAWPLQKLAASAAVGTLRLFMVDATNFGTKIMMMDGRGELRTLNVAEACAGLRSLMTFLMVAGTVAFLSSRPMWEKVAQTLMAIPIAIFCNVVRVAGQGLLDRYWSREISEGFAHQFVGLIMLIPGFFLILLVGWIIDRLFVEEVDPKKLSAAGARGRKVVQVARRQPSAPTAAAQAPDRVPPALAMSATVDAPLPATVAEPAAGVPATATTNPVAAAPDDATDNVAEPVMTAAPLPSMQNAAKPPAAQPTRPMAPRPAPARPSATVAKPAAAPAGAPRPAASPTAAKPTAPRPAAPAAQQPTSTLKQSTTPRPAPAPMTGAAGGSTLKPSSRPAAQRTVVSPASGLKPAGATPPASLKPGAPARRPGAPAAPVAAPAVSRSPAKPAAPIPQQPQAPARRPASAPPANVPPADLAGDDDQIQNSTDPNGSNA